jgi:hypothetical protein
VLAAGDTKDGVKLWLTKVKILLRVYETVKHQVLFLRVAPQKRIWLLLVNFSTKFNIFQFFAQSSTQTIIIGQ